jgi:EcoEI R protein C-terminal/Type I restriction modification DNA specificity domain
MVLSDVPNGKALAKCYLVKETDSYTLNQRICAIRSAKFHSKFLFYQLNRNQHFLAFDNGENQTNLRLNQVLSCPLLLPSFSEQESIAATLDSLSEGVGPEPEPGPRPQRIKVKLADGKARTIQHMMCTTFWHHDGTPMSAQQFMELLFGKLPEFFKDEAELRTIWSAPDTRKKLLQGLSEKGFGRDQLAEMQRIIDAEKSDLFDVLAHVAYAMPPLTRAERADTAKVVISTHFNTKQQVFLDFVLSHYVSVGVDELDQEKLTPLLRLKYHDSIADAVADLGMPEEIGRVFSGFQRFLYQQAA